MTGDTSLERDFFATLKTYMDFCGPAAVLPAVFRLLPLPSPEPRRAPGLLPATAVLLLLLLLAVRLRLILWLPPPAADFPEGEPAVSSKGTHYWNESLGVIVDRDAFLGHPIRCPPL